MPSLPDTKESQHCPHLGACLGFLCVSTRGGSRVGRGDGAVWLTASFGNRDGEGAVRRVTNSSEWKREVREAPLTLNNLLASGRDPDILVAPQHGSKGEF